ncbi:MAG: glycoside hydrolase, partial [Candidatus Hydrogenedentes bacterium]|nr:glycoside hydrolase [Candidatus Hydrogenedentota bacterium]
RNNKRLFYTRSTDEGRHWAAPEERTPVLKGVNFPWLRIGAGPGHGIQLRNERLIVPLWYCDAEPRAKEKRYRAGIVYSDDEGTTWQPGGLVPETIPRLNECTVIERSDGSLLLNMRAYKAGYRATAESNDGGETWSEPTLDPHLPDPTCQGSILRLRNGNVLFTNIPGAERAGLSVRLSEDEGKSWKHTRLLEAGPSAYSDLAQRADGRILCLFEWGTTRYNEQISLATFPQSWVQDTK